jgi:hypothetical protein
MIWLFSVFVLWAAYWVLRAEGLLPLSAEQQARVMKWLREWRIFR